MRWNNMLSARLSAFPRYGTWCSTLDHYRTDLLDDFTQAAVDRLDTLQEQILALATGYSM
jgi:hypothetical protein